MAIPRILLLSLVLLAGCTSAGERHEPRDAATLSDVEQRLHEAVSVRVWARG